MAQNYLNRRREIWQKMNGKCSYCGRDIDFAGHWHIDHMAPRWSGHGEGYKHSNMVPACARCNLRKSGDTPGEFKIKLVERVKKDLASRLWANIEDVLYMLPPEVGTDVFDAYQVILQAMRPENISFYMESRDVMPEEHSPRAMTDRLHIA